MRLLDTPKPRKGTWRYKICEFFVNHVNFCEGVYYGTDFDKPQNRLYEFLYEHWLFPFKQNDCICCNTVRGLVYGGILGFMVGKLV